jgi:hypothetical protein
MAELDGTTAGAYRADAARSGDVGSAALSLAGFQLAPGSPNG